MTLPLQTLETESARNPKGCPACYRVPTCIESGQLASLHRHLEVLAALLAGVAASVFLACVDRGAQLLQGLSHSHGRGPNGRVDFIVFLGGLMERRLGHFDA